jgi:hypothetical protein
LSWVPFVLVDTYERAGKFATAGALSQQALADAKSRFGAGHPETAAALAVLGRHLLLVQQPAEAEPVLRQCLAIRETKEPNAARTFNAKSLLGGALLGQMKYAEAEPLLLQGYEGFQQRVPKVVPPDTKKHLAEAAERLAGLYDATGRPDQARALRAKQ